MAGSKAAWGIEVGSFAVKAIRLERSGEQITVSDFGEFPHKRPLSTPDLDVDEMIRLTLGTLASQKNLEMDPVVMSVEGRSSLPRFAKLPPVEDKKIPARLVGAEPTIDFALLKIETPIALSPVSLAPPGRLAVGHWAIAVGDPPGAGTTFTVLLPSRDAPTSAPDDAPDPNETQPKP